ncbi:MAG: hypothetical protein ACO0C9_01115 [Candidatus Methanosuratincola verstraetei]|jgi:hypothetical protein|uniref:Uncharacterized protein n=2 Tax=Candidatus Methanosuratincola (ex Vanwonterghem et al. 2016) TaxID=1915412 RepID=A0A7J3UYD1_9CREN|nr:MAG: hypothetical protein Metus_0135 [Candidatus Methanosuratincola subterraneus]
MSSFEYVVGSLMERLINVKGIVDAVLLPTELKNEILSSELCEENNTGGFFLKYNAGVREALKRDHLLAAITDENYTYPPEPVELIYLGDTVGVEIRDKSLLESYKKDENAMLLGDSFVIFKDKLPPNSVRKAMSGEIKVFIPPMSVGVEAPEGIHGLVLGMPSTYTDLLLKDWLRKKGIDVSNKNLGVVLIGFNIHKL